MTELLQDDRVAEDPLDLFSRAGTWLHTAWLRNTYPLAAIGRGTSIHYSCELRRSFARYISIGENVYVGPDVWFNVTPSLNPSEAKVVLGRGCKIGRRATISAKNWISLGADVLLGPNVLIMDHNHEFSDPLAPIHAQGVTEGGRITIEENCWLGYGAAIVCGHSELILGRNSIVGANSVVTRSVPPFSIVAGNPARVVKRFDQPTGEWVKMNV